MTGLHASNINDGGVKKYMLPNIYAGQGLDEVIRFIPTDELRHMQRVGRLTNEMTWIVTRYPRYEMYEGILHNFGNVAFYHDIGKAWVPADVLTKTQNLTHEEYELILMHPLYAQEFFEKNPDIISVEASVRQLIVDAAVFHHERWDGNGYPYGLSSLDIPLVARITSICDVYDAITNQRPYSEARTHEAACAEIERYLGEQFDPDIALIFLENQKAIYTLTMGGQPS